MNFNTKIIQLRNIIFENFNSCLKTKKVAIFGLPCHGNIGDTYISLGEYQMIKDLNLDLIYSQALFDKNSYPQLPKDCTILLQGGGDFGDIWRSVQVARIDVIKNYKNNPIIVCPQTVFYNDESKLTEDAKILNSISNLTIFVRDTSSLSILKKHLTCKICLVPDMAFCIHPKDLLKNKLKVSKDILLIMRKDKEANNFNPIENLQCDVLDWPLISKVSGSINWFYRFYSRANKFSQKKTVWGLLLRNISILCLWHYTYPDISRQGVLFVSKYKKVYTTRMHAAILCVLLGKPFVMLNNSYGKNKNFFTTWFNDLEDAEFLDK